MRVAVKHRCYVLYDSVYQRLDYVGWFVNPAFAHPEWRDWVVSLSGLSKMDMFGASTGARACWMVISDQIRANGVRAREILANLSAWLVATPSTLAQDWALAALQSPLAALRRPSPYMRERRDFMAQAADELAPLGVERTDFGGTFYSPLAFPGLVGEPFDRLRNGVHEKAVVKDSVDAFELLLSGGVGGIPFVAFAGARGRGPLRDVAAALVRLEGREGAVGLHRPRPRPHREAGPARLERPRRPAAAAPRRTRRRTPSGRASARRDGYDALDGLDPKAFAAARKRVPRGPAPRGAAPDRDQAPRLDRPTAPSSSTARCAPRPQGAPDRARLALTHLEWNPLMEARLEYEETIARPPRPVQRGAARLRGAPDQPRLARRAGEGRARAPAATASSPARTATSSSASPTRSSSRTRRRSSKILASVARANVLFHLACERVGIAPTQNAHPRADRPPGQLDRRDRRRRQGRDALPAGDRGPLRRPPEHVDAFLGERVPTARRAELARATSRGSASSPSARTSAPSRTCPTSSRRSTSPSSAGVGVDGPADARRLPHPLRSRRGRRPRLRGDVRHGRAEREDRDRRRLHARPRRPRGGRAPPRRARAAARRARPGGDLPDRRRTRRLPRRLRPGPPGRHPAVRARRRRHDAGHPRRRARGGRAPRRRVPRRGRARAADGPGARSSPAPTREALGEAARGRA